MTNSVYCQLLSQVILVTAQWAHDQSSQGNYNRSYPWDQQHGHPLMKTDMITEAVDCQICLQQRPTQTSYTPLFLQADQPTAW